MLKSFVRLFKVCFFIVITAAVFIVFLGYRYLQSPLSLPTEGLIYNLPQGSSLSAMAYDLQKNKVLTHPRLFIAFSRVTDIAKQIQAGEYFLAQGMTPLSLLEKLQRGEVQSYRITFVEGWRVSELLRYLSKQSKIKREVNLNDNFWFQRRQSELEYQSFEGLFYPDTYQFTAETSDSQLLKIAYQRMQAVLADEWQQRDANLPYKNAYEALIMASLIEKETGLASERKEIAGVFVRRLQKRMRLQTDPAVIYGLGEAFDGNLRSRHLKDSRNPYNTYRHHGLPPTPIALAGREAIHAALHPAAGESLYFVAKGDGSHYFSTSLEEHLRAVQQYQIKQRRKNYQSAPSQ